MSCVEADGLVLVYSSVSGWCCCLFMSAPAIINMSAPRFVDVEDEGGDD
jgi:hypothetical protein